MMKNKNKTEKNTPFRAKKKGKKQLFSAFW